MYSKIMEKTEKSKILSKIKELEHLEKVYISYSSTYNEKDTQPIRESLLKQAKSIRKEIEDLKRLLTLND